MELNMSFFCFFGEQTIFADPAVTADAGAPLR